MQTIILGNGIIGMTIAFRMAKRSANSDSIVIVGKQMRDKAATFAAPAMLNSFAEVEKGSLDSEIDLYRFELSREATAIWPAFEQEINQAAYPNINCTEQEIKPFDSGTYVVNNTAADDLDDESFDAIVNALKKYKEPFSHVSPKDIPNYMPEQRHRATRAIYIDGEGWVNPRLLMGKIELALKNFGNVTFIDASATKLNYAANKISAVELDDGQTILADEFILATGAAVTDLLNASKLPIKIPRVFYGVGVSIEIKSPDHVHTKCIRTPNRGLACGLYTAPYIASDDYPKDHVIIGASNFISPTPYHYGRLTSVEGLVRGAIEQINSNFYRADFIRTNIGWRPTSQDTYPLMGKTSISNLIIVTGTKREGFHLAPVISEKIVALLLGEPVDEQFNLFKPERKVIKSLTRKEAIAKAVRHQISAAYQHGFNPSKSRMPEQIKQMYQDNLERLHDQVGAIDWGIPPEMLDMYKYGHAVV